MYNIPIIIIRRNVDIEKQLRIKKGIFISVFNEVSAKRYFSISHFLSLLFFFFQSSARTPAFSFFSQSQDPCLISFFISTLLTLETAAKGMLIIWVFSKEAQFSSFQAVHFKGSIWIAHPNQISFCPSSCFLQHIHLHFLSLFILDSAPQCSHLDAELF